MAGSKSTSPKLPVRFAATANGVEIVYRRGPVIRANLIAPERTSSVPARMETIESNSNYFWQRFHFADDKWPRIVEVRADALGQVVLTAHLQSLQAEFGRAPDFGWNVETECDSSTFSLDTQRTALSGGVVKERLTDGRDPEVRFWSFRRRVTPGPKAQPDVYRITTPFQSVTRRGKVTADQTQRALHYRYLRCRADENVPMQQASWRRATIKIWPPGCDPISNPEQLVATDGKLWTELYGGAASVITLPAPNGQLLDDYHREATIASAAVGDDAGNITGFNSGSRTGAPFGMNRLNHCDAMFTEALHGADGKLLDAALLWCDNFHDLSIWWGPKETGGTRYNNLAAMGQTPPPSDPQFMWRSNSAVSFCTKGFDNFFIAYEQTGDPRYMEALNGQLDYASKYMTAGANYTRNVGCVRDFVNLYKWTGEQRFLDQAIRLFRELRTQLSTGDLFTESGKPIEANPPFIENDAQGYQHPFAKPYILGYALEGLPELLKHCPNEPKLREVVTSVADFMVKSQDPVGGWRYPHPRSSYVIMSQAMEHAWQIMQADRVLSSTGHEARVDAIERVLRQRIRGWLATGKIFSGITGWEMATGKVKKQEEIPALYAHPEDRDVTRDYREGRADFGSSPPEGIVYFPEVLRYYLKFRPASRLLRKPSEDEPLGMVLKKTLVR